MKKLILYISNLILLISVIILSKIYLWSISDGGEISSGMINTNKVLILILLLVYVAAILIIIYKSIANLSSAFIFILSIVFITAIVGFWLVGMHGHIMFRVNMIEDWLLLIGIVIFLCTSIFSFYHGSKKNNSKLGG